MPRVPRQTFAQFLAEVEAQAASYAPTLSRAFRSVTADAVAHAPRTAIEAALRRGDVSTAVDLILGPSSEDLATWTTLRHAYRAAIVTSAAALVSTFPPLERAAGSPLRFVFDVQNPRALQAIANAELNLIRQISTSTREGIRRYLTFQLDQGANPRALIPQLAGRMLGERRVGGVIGLTDRQALAVANYRNALERGSLEALQRKLRDKRFDASVRAAAKGGPSLSAEQVNTMVTRYESRYLAYRAETIARTESIGALAVGRKAGWDSAIDAGAVDGDSLTKMWQTAEDERVRPAHEIMNKTKVGYHEEFILLDPKTGRPTGETTWGPPYDVNCRCIPWIRPGYPGEGDEEF